jgi:glyoxylase-like metal-dependent hydrolase (beta-lactamase superfamily II)
VPTVHLLNPGYTGNGVASSVSLIETDEALIVIDPGMVRSRELILDSMGGMGYVPEDVTDVVISHTSRSAEGLVLAPGVTLWKTPGHTPQDVTTVVEEEEGAVALTHLSTGPIGGPYAAEALHRGRARVLEIAATVIPGHGPMFTPDETTPR